MTFSGGAYAGEKTLACTIGQAKNTLSAKGKTVKLSASKLKAKALKVSRKKAAAVKKGAARSALTYKLGGVSKKKFKKYFKVDKKTGAITVRKGLKKGKYTVKVKVVAKATKNYKGATRTAKVTVKVA